MDILIVANFKDDYGRSWKKGDKPYVSISLAEKWITEGKAIDPDDPPDPETLESKQVESGIKKKKK